MKQPVSVISPDVQRVGDRRRQLDAERVHQIPDDLGGAGGLGVDVVDCAEAGVVVVVVDVEDVGARALQGLGRVALEVAAVQEHDRALLEVVGRLGHEPGRAAKEAVLMGQRQVAQRR